MMTATAAICSNHSAIYMHATRVGASFRHSSTTCTCPHAFYLLLWSSMWCISGRRLVFANTMHGCMVTWMTS